MLPFSCCQSFPASRPFLMSRFFHQVSKVLESFSISPSNEYSGLISFRINWFDLAVQGTLRSLLQHPQFKSITFLALSFLYGPTLTSTHDCWKNNRFDYMELCWQSNVCAFNMLSRLVIAFLPKSKHLLISWLQ